MESIIGTTVEVEPAQKVMAVDDIKVVENYPHTFRSPHQRSSVAQSHCRELGPWLGQFSYRATSNSGSRRHPK